MDDNQERERIKKIAKRIAIMMIIILPIQGIYFVLSDKYSLRVVLISIPLAMILALSIPALIYFWKGPIK